MVRGAAIMLATAACLSGSPVNAAASCSGRVTDIATYVNGYVNIRSSWRNDWTYICNVNEEWKGVPPQTCWAWFAQINSSIAEAKPLFVYYADLASTADCATIPAYDNAEAPTYVRMQNP